MGSLILSDKILRRYFGYLKGLDNDTKSKLIKKLKVSLKNRPNENFDLNCMFGAWEDSRDSYEIIDEIKNSRVEKTPIQDF